MTTSGRRGLPALLYSSWYHAPNTTRCRYLTLKERRGGMAEKDNKIENEEYVGTIKGGLRPTMRLVVMGIVNKKPQSMVVSLSSDPVEEDFEGDVGLQVKVNFLAKAVQRNARLAGNWGTSENTLSFFPFAAGEPFKV
ncbi:unnamed protein product [Oncorhynchus mykiss]|uniref:Galectin n=1 Tax=Oncorhynchus mykiss TaxID=8022 RepID=A0A060YPD3_ONCMY|nr:unnamed protein product [Oncorhynchus mykiss]